MNKVLKFSLFFTLIYILVSIYFGYFIFQEIEGIRKSQENLDSRIWSLNMEVKSRLTSLEMKVRYLTSTNTDDIDDIIDKFFAVAIDDLNKSIDDLNYRVDDLERRVRHLEIWR
jgi:hypothetical protein